MRRRAGRSEIEIIGCLLNDESADGRRSKSKPRLQGRVTQGVYQAGNTLGVFVNYPDCIAGKQPLLREACLGQAMFQIFPQFLQAIGPRHLIMCHPGLSHDSSERSNVWMRCREHEFRYFASPAFPADLASRGLRVAKFSEI